MAEELYSDTEDGFGFGTRTVSEVVTGCPLHQAVVGDAPIAVATQELPTHALGAEAWNQLLMFTVGGCDTMVKQDRLALVIVFAVAE